MAECILCDGPCKEPLKLGPIPADYPFLPPEVIAMTQPQEVEPPPPPRGKRSRRPHEDTAKRPGENTAAQLSEDRSC